MGKEIIESDLAKGEDLDLAVATPLAALRGVQTCEF